MMEETQTRVITTSFREMKINTTQINTSIVKIRNTPRIIYKTQMKGKFFCIKLISYDPRNQCDQYDKSNFKSNNSNFLLYLFNKQHMMNPVNTKEMNIQTTHCLCLTAEE